MNALRLLVIICTLWSSQLFAAETPRQVTWDDLTVKPPPVENPIERLSQEQIDALAEVSAMRHRKSRGIQPSAIEAILLRLTARFDQIRRPILDKHDVGLDSRSKNPIERESLHDGAGADQTEVENHGISRIGALNHSRSKASSRPSAAYRVSASQRARA